LVQCFVRKQLEDVLFAGEPDARLKPRPFVRKLSDFARNKTDNRHLHFDECRDSV
jgi:hypothetical protein